jgi:hypothetical protein
VDYQRERISLSIKALQQPPAVSPRQTTGNAARGGRPPAKTPPPPKPAASVEDLMRKFNRR